MKHVTLSILGSTACALLLAMPLAAANARSARKPETLDGKIAMVNPARKLVVVKTPDGVPYDMMVTPKTRIRSGNQTVTLKDLTQDTNQTVSVKFTPERRGDIARSIELGG